MPIGDELVVDNVDLVLPEVPILFVDVYIVESIHPSVGFVLHVVRVAIAQASTALTLMGLLDIQWRYNRVLLDIMSMPIKNAALECTNRLLCMILVCIHTVQQVKMPTRLIRYINRKDTHVVPFQVNVPVQLPVPSTIGT